MNIFKKIIASGLISCALCSMGAQAAPVLSFGNSGTNLIQSYSVGDTISLDLWISGLAGTDDLGGVDLAGFDMDLSFNGGVTGYQNTIFSTDLDSSLFYGLSANPTSADGVNLSGLSLLWDLSLQADALKLFTLTFTAHQAGTSILELDNILLSNSWFDEMVGDAYFAELTINDKPVSVPEPGALGLVLSALAVLAMRRRRSV